MSVTQMKGDFRTISGFVPTSRTVDAVNDMNDVINMSSLLEKILMFIPAFQIFAGRNTYTNVTLASTAQNIKDYDWVMFAQAVQSIDTVKRERLEKIAFQAALLSMGKERTLGKERTFWECVYNAL
ncbi:hypothetical protein [Vibrio spartinae]|uniref:Uncharacterized protein n=1 Tax=Vibrio spartinae TaxID=1918945 RepID=A0ABX6R5C2_9VIBR|nr:hypothetical protein [Vibrio spartinae]QMV16768.1 hypothetical protein Vspart_04176 [Vibrio spartinae]